MTETTKIAERLKIARIATGYKSSRAFAKRNSFPEVSYTQHESNKRKISAESLFDYSKALNVNVSWLLTGEGYPSTLRDINKKITNYVYEHKIKLQTSVNAPFIDHESICTVDLKILNQILSKLMNISIQHRLNVNCEDLLVFAYKLYNNVSSTLDDEAKDKMIEIATESLMNAHFLSERKINIS